MVVNTHEAKTHLSRLIERAAAGEEIILAKAGKPMAKLVPYEAPKEPRSPGGWEGKVWMADDFDETPQEIIDAFYGD
jgi:prevent-host-death family protein